jgi:hypothetical protein
MSLRAYYERQAATTRRLAEQAISRPMAQRLLSMANEYEQRAQACDFVLPGERSLQQPR